MSPQTILTLLALLGSLVLLAQHRPIAFPVVALVASGLEALSAFHLVQLSITRVPLALLLGAALALAGVAVHLRAAAKSTVTASTVVALVGALQTLSALHLR